MATEFRPDRYDRMDYRRCGRSGLFLPALSLGLWQGIGSYAADEASRRVLFHAFDCGITHFDLANNYGHPPGHSEELMGQLLTELPRDEVVVSTKAGYRMGPGPYGEWGSRKYLISSCEASLRRLGLDYVDIFYSHRYDAGTPLEETLGALETLVRQGKALYVGLSNYAGAQFVEALRLVRERGWPPILVNQPRYHLLQRQAAEEVLPLAAEAGVGIAVFSPLAQGLLSDRYLQGVPADSRAVRGTHHFLQQHVTEENRGLLRELDLIAKRRNQTLAQLALAWILRDNRVSTVIIGASRIAQVDENLKAIRSPAFGAEDLLAIDAICRRFRL